VEDLKGYPAQFRKIAATPKRIVMEHLMTRMQTIGNYELVEKIAEGGMGTVYKGRSLTSGMLVAIKIVPSHLLSNPVVLKRFEQEYNAARQIDHPNIVKALDFGRHEDTRYLVMEYVEGESLGQKIERDGRMDEKEAVRIITQVAEALQKAHKQGLIHRDVKPDNVLITHAGEAKLTDLGLVKELETDLNLTRTGRGLGTPHFMAPEQFRNAKKADVRCDLYSLGATLYMMVTGELPFKSTNGPLDAWMKKINNEIDPPRKLVPGLSDRIDWAIRRSMSPDPLQRPENCREFIEDLTGESAVRLSSTEPILDTIQEYWYLVYHDEEGVLHTVKGTTNGIRKSLREGLLGDAENIRIARTKAGPFELVRNFAEFRDLVIQPPTGKMCDARPRSSIEHPSKPPSPASEHKSAGTTPAPMIPKPSLPARKTAVAVSQPSDTLSITTLTGPIKYSTKGTKPKPSDASGPRINFSGSSSASSSSELWKWLGLALLFGGIGIGAAFVLPLLRQFRLF
jgi:serine/threonine protein kinase